MSRDSEELRSLAACFNVIGGLLAQEPTKEQLQSYKSDDVFASIPFGYDDEHVRKGIGRIEAWLKSSDLENECIIEDLQNEYIRLFDGFGMPCAPCWANFHLDINRQIMGEITLRVRREYEKYGLHVDEADVRPDDRLGLMMQFLALLANREAEAFESGRDDEASDLDAAQKEFVKNYILPWIGEWHIQITNETKSGFYQGVGEVAYGLIRSFA